MMEGKDSLQDGDLLLRNGQEPGSQLIKNLSPNDKSYSHAGIVFMENGIPFVYHLTPGKENEGGRMLRDSLENFCNPRYVFGYAIYRYNLETAETNKLKDSVKGWYTKELPFDHSYDLKTDDKMYSTEMVKKAYEKATANRISIPTTKPGIKEATYISRKLKIPRVLVLKANIVPLDAVYSVPQCRLVKRFDFSQQ